MVLVAAGVSLIAAGAHADPVVAKVTHVEGDAKIVATGSSDAKPVTEGMAVPIGSTIKTGKDGFVVLSLMPGADSIITTDSEVTVSELDFEKSGEKVESRKVKLSLASGMVLNNLAKADGVSDFKISSPMGVAAARGTTWAFSFGKGTGNLSVVNSVVTLTTPNGQVISVGEGNMVDSINGVPGAVVQMTQAQLDALIAILQRFGFTVNATTRGFSITGPTNPSSEPEVGNPPPPAPPTPVSAER
jgi:hypothetical protein